MELPIRYWPPQIREDGWVDYHIHAMHGNEAVGRLGIAVMPRTTAEELYPTAEAFYSVFKEPRRTYEEWVAYYPDIPHVSYINVEHPFQRQKLATRLYILGAKLMAEQGMCLAASDRRNPDSNALWDHLISRPDIPTITLPNGVPAIQFPKPA